MTNNGQIESARQVLKMTFGVVPLLAGLDKFTNLLAEWPRYLSPTAAAILPVDGQTFMYVAGVVEMAVGLAILTRWTTLGSYVAAGWLVAVAANLVATGFIDVAVRDLAMASAAFALARLSEARDAAEVRTASPAESTAHATQLGRVA